MLRSAKYWVAKSPNGWIGWSRVQISMLSVCFVFSCSRLLSSIFSLQKHTNTCRVVRRETENRKCLGLWAKTKKSLRSSRKGVSEIAGAQDVSPSIPSVSREQRAESREHSAESRQQRADSREQRAHGRYKRTRLQTGSTDRQAGQHDLRAALGDQIKLLVDDAPLGVDNALVPM
jgi:hypothetical protein